MKWACSILAVLVLYPFTVEPLNLLVRRPKWHAFRKGGFWMSRSPSPEWLKVYGQPHDWLCENTPAGDPLRGYKKWVWDSLYGR